MQTEILNEKELDPTVNLWNGYTYVINGVITILQLPHGVKKMTVAEYKAANLQPGADESDIKSLTNCDMKGRNLPLKKAGA